MESSERQTAGASAGAVDHSPKSVLTVQQDLRQLASEAAAVHELLTSSLRRLAAYFRTPYIAVTARLGGGTLDDCWHQGKTDPEFWRPLVDGHLTDVFGTGQAGCKLMGPADRGSRIGLVGASLRDEWGRCYGAIALVLGNCDEASARQQLATLESLTGYLALCVALMERGAGRSPSESGGAQIDNVIGALSAAQKPREIAFSITNRLRNKTGCDQVALGVPSGPRIRVLSVSGMEDVHPRSPGVRQLRSAMEECYDCDTTIVCPGSDVWAKSAGGVGYRLHWQWSQAAGSDSVASFLLTEGDEDVAVVSLRRKADRPLTESEVEGIKESISHLGLALRLSQLATRSVAAHVVDSVRGGLRSFLQPARRKWQIAAAACLALTTWMVFGTLEYRVVVPCTLQAESRQHISAPFDGVLVAQAAIAGQQVTSGQLLCRLDDRELLGQKRKLEAQINTLEKQKDEALALEQRSKVQVLGAQQEEVRAQMDLVDWQLERAAVRAPVDAVVLTGDLRERVGSPVKAGEALFEIAPPGKVFVELAIPEEEIDEVSQGLQGQFASNALPEQMHAFEVSLVRPMAEVRDERTVFVCEASLAEAAPWLRPGMEGMARVSVGRRPVWWVTLHQMIDFVRMKAWF